MDSGQFLSVLLTYKWTILFYAALIAVIYLFRRKFDWQAKFIGLYRTKVGLKLMDAMGRKRRLFVALGYTGVVVGFAGMLFITVMLVKGLYDLLFVPGAPPVISPVIPGAPVLGTGIEVPLIIGWLALFAVIVVHEFSHGVVSRAHGIPVKSSGLMVFGPLGGAFVEPDEDTLKKKSRMKQLSVFAAGPFSNVLLALVVLLLLNFALTPLLGSFIATNGVVFGTVQPGYPAAAAGVRPNVVYDRLDNRMINTTDDLLAGLQDLKPNGTVELGSSATGQDVTFVATANPSDPAKGYLGVILADNLRDPSLGWLYAVVSWITRLFLWIFLLSLGIGLANLLPLGPVDGGRMLRVVTEKLYGEKKGASVWAKISIAVIVVIVILLLVPIIKAFL